MPHSRPGWGLGHSDLVPDLVVGNPTRGWQPYSWQGSWNEIISEVLSNPRHFMILYDSLVKLMKNVRDMCAWVGQGEHSKAKLCPSPELGEQRDQRAHCGSGRDVLERNPIAQPSLVP